MRIRYWSSDVCSSDLRALRSPLLDIDEQPFIQILAALDVKHQQRRNKQRLALHHSQFRHNSKSPNDIRRYNAAPRRRGQRAQLMMPFHARDSSIATRSEEHTSELQSLMRISYAVFCLKKKKQT